MKIKKKTITQKNNNQNYLINENNRIKKLLQLVSFVFYI